MFLICLYTKYYHCYCCIPRIFVVVVVENMIYGQNLFIDKYIEK